LGKDVVGEDGYRHLGSLEPGKQIGGVTGFGVLVGGDSVRHGQKKGVVKVYVVCGVVGGKLGHLGSVDPGRQMGVTVDGGNVTLRHLGSVDPG
jgi:hypothetical protein